jgi:hypothetical protein
MLETGGCLMIFGVWIFMDFYGFAIDLLLFFYGF